MEIDSYAIGYQNGYKDAEDKYKPKELDLERKEVIRTLNKLANDYLVYPNETKALDYAIRDLEKPSRVDWHLYPKETPNKVDRWYMVTCNNSDRVGMDFLMDDSKWLVGNVIAWAELPKPYEEGVE